MDHNVWTHSGRTESIQRLSGLFFNFLTAVFISPSSLQSWSKAFGEEVGLLDGSIVNWCCETAQEEWLNLWEVKIT